MPSPRSARVLLVSLFALAAGLLAAVVPNVSTSTSRGRDTGPSPADRQAVEQLAQDYAFAWSAHDVQSLAGLYTQDASIVTTDEGGARGRQGVRSFLQARAGDSSQDARATLTVQNVEAIAQGVLLADVQQSVTERNPSGVGSTDVGTLQVSWVLTQDHGAWRIRSERIAPTPSPRAPAQVGVGGAGVIDDAGRGVLNGRVNPTPSRNQLRLPTTNWPRDPQPGTWFTDPTRSPFQEPGGF